MGENQTENTSDFLWIVSLDKRQIINRIHKLMRAAAQTLKIHAGIYNP